MLFVNYERVIDLKIVSTIGCKNLFISENGLLKNKCESHCKSNFNSDCKTHSKSDSKKDSLNICKEVFEYLTLKQLQLGLPKYHCVIAYEFYLKSIAHHFSKLSKAAEEENSLSSKHRLKF